MLEQPDLNPADVLTPWSFVLLIHGYNNDMSAGRDAYEGFRRTQRDVGGIDDEEPVTRTSLVDVYWPGDADWGIASFLYYPFSIDKAKTTASALAGALGTAVTLHGFKQIDIVAHSMGCRVTLELLRHLERVPGVLVRRVVFMAGAVPTFMFEPEEVHGLRSALDVVASAGALSLFSPADNVLSVAFPLGQTLGGSGEGLLPTALGHGMLCGTGLPPHLMQNQVPGADHSDYWGWKAQTLDKARDAGARVRAFLDLGPIRERRVAERVIPARVGPDLRNVGVPRETPTRGADSP